MNSPEVDQLLDPNYSEYAPVYDAKFANWKNLNQRWAEENVDRWTFVPYQELPCQKAPATKVLLTGAAVIVGIYFVGFWVIPFAKALWAAR